MSAGVGTTSLDKSVIEKEMDLHVPGDFGKAIALYKQIVVIVTVIFEKRLYELKTAEASFSATTVSLWGRHLEPLNLQRKILEEWRKKYTLCFKEFEKMVAYSKKAVEKSLSKDDWNSFNQIIDRWIEVKRRDPFSKKFKSVINKIETDPTIGPFFKTAYKGDPMHEVIESQEHRMLLSEYEALWVVAQVHFEMLNLYGLAISMFKRISLLMY